MCGIAGIISLSGEDRLQASYLRNMMNSMRKRGPDDEGSLLINSAGEYRTYFGDDTPIKNMDFNNIPFYPEKHLNIALESTSRIALGHRRLSIVDLSPHGHQPMMANDGRYWIVYNGEIYNYANIAKELKKQGVRFHGNSDTEVLINAYMVWGEECLSRFNGMFSFAIWDNKEKTLFCARDRIGIKPFYYTIQNDQFIFASDIKALIASKLYKPEVDDQGLFLAMTFGMAPRPKTAFKEVHALEQSHWLKLYPDGRIEKKKYWSIPIGTQKEDMSEVEAIELLDDELTQSIKRRLIADVPVGTFMSGGIDSTLISSIASQAHPGIKAFTLGYENSSPEMDETLQAKATAKLHPMDHVVQIVNIDDTLKNIETRIDCYEEPYYGLGANHVISKIVKDNNIKVVLNGLGGDELFAGYNYYGMLKYRKRLNYLRPLLKILPIISPGKGQKLTTISSASSADRLHSAVRSRLSKSTLSSIFSSEATRDFNSVEYIRDLYVGELEFTDDIEAMSYMDLMNYVSNHHVHRVDQFTMAYSIEGRFPFLDHKLVEAAFKIPSKYKLNGKIHKYVLRKVAEKYIAPECLSMKKKGFGLPVKQWMQGPLKDLIASKLKSLSNRNSINQEVVQQQYLYYKKGTLSPMDIWHLVALEYWYERFIDGEGNF